MNMKNTIYDMLKRSRAFIYKVDGDYYLLGHSVFRKCNENEIEIYNQYINELNRIKELTYQLENRDVKQLVLLLDKILELGEKEFLVENENIVNHKLYELLNRIDESIFEDIKRQRENYTETLNYKDGIFYRNKS